MPMVKKKTHEDRYALLHLLFGHNALNLTVTTLYLLAAVTFMFLEWPTSSLFSNYLLLDFNSVH